MKKEYKKLIKNTGLLAIGSFGSSLLGMLLIPFYTAVLSTSDYGISDLIVTTTSLLYPFTTLAISESIMRFTLDKGVDKKSVYSIGITIALAGYILILLCLPLIKKTAIGAYYTYFLAYYLFYCLHTVTSYFVKGLEKIKTYSVAGLLNSMVVISCNLLFLLVFKMGIVGYLLSSILGHAITTGFMFVRAKLYRYIQPFWKIDQLLLRRMIQFSIPIIPNSISWWIANSSDKYVLNHYTDVSQVGIYAVSYKIPTIMITITGFFISAWQISAVEDFGTEKSQKFFSEIYKKCFALNMLISATLIVFSKVMAGFLYSADFFAAWRFVPILVIANVFNVMASFMGTIYTASKKTKMLSISTMIGATANILMNFLLIPFLGALGAAIATALSYAIMWIIRMVNTRHIMKLSINLKTDSLLLLLLIAEIVAVTVDSWRSWATALMIYCVLIFASKEIVREFLKLIFDKLHRSPQSINKKENEHD